MTGRLLVDLDNRLVKVSVWTRDGLPEQVSEGELAWPLDAAALEELRWYLEDYLLAPFGVWEDRGPAIQSQLSVWGEAVFASAFSAGPARDAYQRARDSGLELVLRSAAPRWLGLPWELMRDPDGPVALGLGGISRALPVAELAKMTVIPGGRLRVLMVISRPAGTADIGFRMVARPLMERLEAVGGEVDLEVLRPPTLRALEAALADAGAAGAPFQVVHFDGHGALPGWPASGLGGEGVLVFENSDGGSDPVRASRVASVLKAAKVPVVVLNACQSGAVGADAGAAVATRLIRDGAAAVVAMAYRVHAVAVAEFMATFYERVFAGDTIGQAVTAGRRRLFTADKRPSPKGELPLADWIVPVHYVRGDVAFPQVVKRRPSGAPSLESMLDAMNEFRGTDGGVESLDPVGVFVGRDDEFYQLEVAARSQRVVILNGPGGNGKTELAKAFARWWRDTGGTDRPDWVLWHSFEPGVASFGLDGVITETGLAVFGPDFARLDTDDRLEAIHRLLEERRLLLIWDNFESVWSMPDPGGVTPPLDEAERDQIKRFLGRVAAKGASAVIITSRMPEEWLGPVYRIIVSGLSRPDAAEYASQLLAAYPEAASRRAGRAFGEVLEWLDGNPLSMRLTLPYLATTSPETLLEALRGTQPFPATGQVGEDRLSSLSASISYSFSHVTPGTSRLLTAVCLFHGIADANVLALFSQQPGVPERFAGTSRQEWAGALDEAARVGLLTGIGSPMYKVHPALPAYLAAQWRADEPSGYEAARQAAEAALASAYADLCSWLSDQIDSANAELGFAVIGLQRRTLSVMLGYALDHQLWSYATIIASPLNAYWDIRGLYEEAAAWTSRVQAATEGPNGSPPQLDSPAGGLWLYMTGRQANRQHDFGMPDHAEATHRRILAMFQAQARTPARQAGIAGEYHGLGLAAQARGRLDEAEDRFRLALAIREELGDRRERAQSYGQLGVIACLRGRLEEAVDWHRQGLAISKQLGDRPGMAVSYCELGNTASLRGRLDEASDWYLRALAIMDELGDRPGMARIYHQLGMTAQDRGRLEDADEWYRQSLAISEELGSRPYKAGTYHQLGRTAQGRGRLDEAGDWYRKALAIMDELGDRPGMATTYHQLGRTAQGRGRLDEAGDWYLKALAIMDELGDRPGMATAYHQLGNVAQSRGRLDEAGDWYRKALAIMDELGDRPGMATAYHQLGNVAQSRGRLDEADDWYRKALAISEELGARPGIATMYEELGITAQSRGRLDEADDWYRKALAINEEVGDRPGIARIYHNLGTTAQRRERLDEADDWYLQSLAIKEELSNRSGMAVTYAQMSMLASERSQFELALELAVRGVTMFDQFPHRMTTDGSQNLARLTARLGASALEDTWRSVTGNSLPQAVRDYVITVLQQGQP